MTNPVISKTPWTWCCYLNWECRVQNGEIVLKRFKHGLSIGRLFSFIILNTDLTTSCLVILLLPYLSMLHTLCYIFMSILTPARFVAFSSSDITKGAPPSAAYLWEVKNNTVLFIMNLSPERFSDSSGLWQRLSSRQDLFPSKCLFFFCKLRNGFSFKIPFFGDVTLRRSSSYFRRFEWLCRFQLQGLKVRSPLNLDLEFLNAKFSF